MKFELSDETKHSKKLPTVRFTDDVVEMAIDGRHLLIIDFNENVIYVNKELCKETNANKGESGFHTFSIPV